MTKKFADMDPQEFAEWDAVDDEDPKVTAKRAKAIAARDRRILQDAVKRAKEVCVVNYPLAAAILGESKRERLVRFPFDDGWRFCVESSAEGYRDVEPVTLNGQPVYVDAEGNIYLDEEAKNANG